MHFVTDDFRSLLTVQERWGGCTIDGFASEPTTLCSRFWTATKCENAIGTNALAQVRVSTAVLQWHCDRPVIAVWTLSEAPLRPHL